MQASSATHQTEDADKNGINTSIAVQRLGEDDGFQRNRAGGVELLRDRTRPLVFFCMADCWMSWNAVKRAASLGYARVYWFADGTDGWRDADRLLVPVTPPPVPVPDGQ